MYEYTDDKVWLVRLRREFPMFGVLYIPWMGLWLAVHGQRRTFSAQTASELRDQLLKAVDHP